MELKKEAVVVRPVFKVVFIAAIIIYMVGSMMILLKLINQVGNIEHQMMHVGSVEHR